MSSSSPPSTLKAYYAQFQKDFSVFLKHRSEEIVEGGRMVVPIIWGEEVKSLPVKSVVTIGSFRLWLSGIWSQRVYITVFKLLHVVSVQCCQFVLHH